jgi:F-type H+-transporting ATPase subunit gamma
MGNSTRDIRRKIKATKSTRQITKAMELVATSKMKRAIKNAVSMRPYAKKAWDILVSVAGRHGEEETISYFEEREESNKILMVLFSTDKGLCGGLNSQLFRKVFQYLEDLRKKSPDVEVDFLVSGKKGQDFIKRIGRNLVAAFPAYSGFPVLKDIFPISKMIFSDFEAKIYDKVILAYTDFISVVNQKPVVRRLLPLSKGALKEMIEGLEYGAKTSEIKKETSNEPKIEFAEYVYEPSKEFVYKYILPHLTEMQVFQAVLEATASEHSARMFAMQNATKSASEMLGDLTLTYNQVRQAGITAEIAEISGSKAAIEN